MALNRLKNLRSIVRAALKLAASGKQQSEEPCVVRFRCVCVNSLAGSLAVVWLMKKLNPLSTIW